MIFKLWSVIFFIAGPRKIFILIEIYENYCPILRKTYKGPILTFNLRILKCEIRSITIREGLSHDTDTTNGELAFMFIFKILVAPVLRKYHAMSL